MSYTPEFRLPQLKRKGLHSFWGGVQAPFYFSAVAVVEGQPMKLKAIADPAAQNNHTMLIEMEPCVAGASDGDKCMGLALQDVYAESTTGQLAQLKGYHFVNDTAQRANSMPIGLLSGTGWAILRNFTGAVSADMQLAIQPVTGLLGSPDNGGVVAADKVPVWAESSGTGGTNDIRIRYDFRFKNISVDARVDAAEDAIDVLEAAGLATVIADPGDGGAIPVTSSGHVDLVTGAAGETRTLAAPTLAGQQLLISLKTDGGGDAVITVATTVNQTGNDTITMGDAGDAVLLVAKQNGANLRWTVQMNDGAALATA